MLKFGKFIKEAYDSGSREHTIYGTIHHHGEDKPKEFKIKTRAMGHKRIDSVGIKTSNPSFTKDETRAIHSHVREHGDKSSLANTKSKHATMDVHVTRHDQDTY